MITFIFHRQCDMILSVIVTTRDNFIVVSLKYCEPEAYNYAIFCVVSTWELQLDERNVYRRSRG